MSGQKISNSPSNAASTVSPTATLTTRTGFRFAVRPVAPGDAAALADFFQHVTKADLRFRFLTSLRKVSYDVIDSMTHVDHGLTEHLVAFDGNGKTIIATAMYAAEASKDHAEVALAIRPEYKGFGVSWSLLDHIAQLAKARGIRKIASIESRDHHEAIELEREMGFTASSYPGDARLVLLEARLAA